MGRSKITGRRLYKGKKYNRYSIDQQRSSGLAESCGYLYLGNTNEKIFDLERLEQKNPKIKDGKKGILKKVLKRDSETSRMKHKRKIGIKKLRNALKKETIKEITEDLENNE